ncbi:hypothetical protein E4U53_006893 [Claviceps sorghi]|nr:hypothetical protein E4U53_006893 [Claviceps sorghi]
MQFSTSAVLAAIAIYAGQTLADCGDSAPDKSWSQIRCSREASTSENFICGTTKIVPSTNGYDVHTGDEEMIIVVRCAGASLYTGDIKYCSANSEGSLDTSQCQSTPFFEAFVPA